MNSSYILEEINRTKRQFSKYNINMSVDFLTGNNIGYGESQDCFNKHTNNQIFIIASNNPEITNLLNKNRQDVEIPDHIALQIIETFHHEVGHILHRLAKIREENSPEAKILSLEYLLSQNGKWYRKNYPNTFMERGCEFRGYANTVLFIEGLDVPTERKEELYKALCENFERAYKSILSKEDRILQGDTYESKALSITKILQNRSLEIFEREKGIFFKKKYKDYLERNCRKFLKYAKPWERANETLVSLLDSTSNLEELKDYNNELRKKDMEKHPEFGNSKF